MTLPTPKLDDRSFEQLLNEATAHVRAKCPAWSDLSVHDPGVMLLELFAHLTEVTLYRLNRVPDRVYVELLKLLGVQLEAPRAARVPLMFSRDGAASAARAVQIPRGTRVTSSRGASGGAPLEFLTLYDAELPIDASSVEVDALHCVRVVEVVGVGTGLPGQTVRATRAPILARADTDFDLKVGVAVDDDALDQRTALERLDGRLYRIWREVEHFADVAPHEEVYKVDRVSGLITFAPAARMHDPETGALLDVAPLACAPAVRAPIALWYATGGGAAGNLPVAALDTLGTKLTGVRVCNERPASGGRDVESLQNAIIRGPNELYALRRAVTARDYEALSQRSGGVARSRALTKAAHWSYAEPGTVELVLVPLLSAEQMGASHRAVTLEQLRLFEVEHARAEVERMLDARRPLGTRCVVRWADYKRVLVHAKVVRRPGVDRYDLKKRILDRLYQRISPLPSDAYREGWSFGQSLGTDTVYGILLSEPGVQQVENVRLVVTEVPTQVTCLAADPTQSSVWFAGSGNTLFRSLDNGSGWEMSGLRVDERVLRVRPHPRRAGLLAVVSAAKEGKWCSLSVSRDSGDSFTPVARLESVRDVSWLERGGEDILFVASEKGLFKIPLAGAGREVATAQQVIVDGTQKDLGFETVTAINTVNGIACVVVAAADRKGVFLSIEGGTELSFRPFLAGNDVDVLAAQVVGSRTFLWAGTSSTGKDHGKGCFRIELVGTWSAMATNWDAFGAQWEGESVHDLAFLDGRVYAASHGAGVPWLDPTLPNPVWNNPTDLDNGLPQRAAHEPFLPILALASDGKRLLAGSEKGIVRSTDGKVYESASRSEYRDGTKITIPPAWLFCSGEHDIDVVDGDATRRY